ncbi:hypothetical protein GMO_11830 [Gluconobacter morbifer G707]|uniref:Uncharacterized protein n=1 Tax=Gluconobacter morbifer G707 TaxID=1088869 RepID=G6XIY3_9PROT|nr:hypothetical protein GMO_11830 [Gluconobacter morbifer G707]
MMVGRRIRIIVGGNGTAHTADHASFAPSFPSSVFAAFSLFTSA